MRLNLVIVLKDNVYAGNFNICLKTAFMRVILVTILKDNVYASNSNDNWKRQRICG